MIGYSEFKSSPLNSSGFLPEQLGLTTVIKILVPIPFDLDLTFESSSVLLNSKLGLHVGKGSLTNDKK